MKRFWQLLLVLAAFLPSVSFAHVLETGKITTIIPEGGSLVSVLLDGADNTSLCSG